MLFAQLPGVNSQAVDLSRVRKFTGDGTAFLKVPGLKKGKNGYQIDGVRVGSVNLPVTETFTYPAKEQEGKFIDSVLPVYAVQDDAEGNPILLRAEFSNDGIWQNGVDIVVTGEWEEIPEPEEKPSAASFAGVTTNVPPQNQPSGGRGNSRTQS